ncbi:molybdopterin cofactor-binding domain-containing protein [Actinomadura rudentiformis]|uniref:molybdopterin cofactor-binding domain-containing protein n=1 Tax=Actinomadura rudentiformis TaxID=359158 RepID=UPI003850434E
MLHSRRARVRLDQPQPEPGSTRDGDWLVGTGMAAAVCNTASETARALVRVRIDGTALVQAATSDMGTGTYTSMTQVAADELGLCTDNVTFQPGDSDMPASPPHGASMTMASVGSAVLDGARHVRRSAIELAVEDPRLPLHGADVVASRGKLRLESDPSRNDSHRALLARIGRARLEATGLFAPPTEGNPVGVCLRRGLRRGRRRPTRQGPARTHHNDHRDGRTTNANLAGYLVPVSADVRNLNPIFLEGRDGYADPIGVKGLGEIVQVGVAPRSPTPSFTLPAAASASHPSPSRACSSSNRGSVGIHAAIGVDLAGHKDVLDLWVPAGGGKSAKFWMGVLEEEKRR